jgi:hypothetical protein
MHVIESHLIGAQVKWIPRILVDFRKAYRIVYSTTYLEETNLWVLSCLKMFHMFVWFVTIAPALVVVADRKK